MPLLRDPVEPFGEVNVYRRGDGAIDIVATILKEPEIEGAWTGLALDASSSMRRMYGSVMGGPFSASGIPNIMQPVVRTMGSFLAGYSSDGKTRLIYWSCGHDGSRTEEIGALSSDELRDVPINGPRRCPWGRCTQLLPALRHFVDQAHDENRFGIYVILTDGRIDDIEAVKQYSLDLGAQIAAGRRSAIKFILIGLGQDIDVSQMEELDDLFEGTGLEDHCGVQIDLWDHKLASDMRNLHDIFAEAVSADIVIANRGRILDQSGQIIHEYSVGLPALLRFTLPAGTTAFTLECPGYQVTQDLTEVLGKR